ncbi:MAG: hypothetical protein KKH51_03265 [Actinobacteria bacterium]|nr:hypothetical protein [Actinomycetota bacterium]
MPTLTMFAKPALAAAIVGAVGLTAAILVPAPTDLDRMWFDQPLGGSVLVEGPTTVRLHLPDKPGTVLIKIIKDGVVAGAVIDSDLEYLPDLANARAPYLAEGSYTFAPGTYQLLPTTDRPSAEGYPITITVVGAAQAPGVDPGNPVPSATPIPTATPVPAPTITPAPTETVAPDVPAPPAPDVPAPDVPAPPPPPVPVVYEMPYGVARMSVLATYTRYQTVQFTVRLATPQQAVPYIQYEVVPYQSPWNQGTWYTIPCTTNLQPDPNASGRYTCSTGTTSIPLITGQQTGYYRVLLTNGDKTYTGDPLYWTVPFATPG